MKKIVTLLLALLLVASCFAFAGCEEEPKCIDGGAHVYRNAYDEPSAYCQKCGEQKDYSNDPSVGDMILCGAIFLVLALISHWLGVQNQSAFFLRAPLILFVIFTITSFIIYGVAHGIVMIVFFVLYILGAAKISN